MGEKKNYEIRSFTICTPYGVSSEWSNKYDEIGGTYGRHREIKFVLINIVFGIPKGKTQSETLKYSLRRYY